MKKAAPVQPGRPPVDGVGCFVPGRVGTRAWLGGMCAAVAVLLAGCEPRGPKALLEGEQMLQQERYTDAIRVLHVATENLPRDARAWNFLGLAYHGAGLDTEASQAYNKALALDHRLSAAHFNLGSLLLEQNQPQLAVNELTAFTLLQPKAVSGWLRLGSAHLKLGKFEAAETAFRTALNLVPRHPEALNGLGCIQVNRRRYVEAVQYFQAALAESPGYATALLNQATVTHRNLNQKSTALQKYRQYLALQPRPENWDAVNFIAQGLADEISGAGRSPLLAVATNTLLRSNAVTAGPVTGTPRSQPQTNGAAALLPGRATASPATPAPAAPARPAPAPVVASTPAPAPERVATPPPAAPAPVTASAPVLLTPPPRKEEEPPPIVVAEVSNPITITPPQEITRPPGSTPPPAPPVVPAASAPRSNSSAPAPATAERPGFFQRLNPFRKTARNEASPAPAPARAAQPAPVADPVVANREMASRQTAPAAPEPPPQGDYKRYRYRQLGRPAAGDRVRAAELVNRGIVAHQERKPDEELAFYRSATLTDPSSYDAFFNLGLASAEQGDWQTALESYEQACAIDSESASSRYNFALALKQAGYPLDAARELETILQTRATDPRALLTLGNLYAQTFRQPRSARQYYLRFLEAEPNHPKAAEVRYWLSANP